MVSPLFVFTDGTQGYTMCGRYMIVSSGEELRRRFQVRESAGVERYNAAPLQMLPVVRREENENRIALLRWGLTPSWATEDFGGRIINARAETVHERPSFRHLLRHRRCLVPATGFYEWLKHPNGRFPFRFSLRDEALFSMAALWDEWYNPTTGEILQSFAIITVPANALVARIHDRMPALLSRESESLWLDINAPLADVLLCLRPYPAEAMVCTPASRRLNNPRYDDASVLTPEEIPPLP